VVREGLFGELLHGSGGYGMLIGPHASDEELGILYTASGLAQVVGEPWLLLTSAFIHANLMHVGFNGLLLWQLGHMLEPNLGRARLRSTVWPSIPRTAVWSSTARSPR
jgi:membrane associated rhomboid family serine protease